MQGGFGGKSEQTLESGSFERSDGEVPPTGDGVLMTGFVGEIPKGCRTVSMRWAGANGGGVERIGGVEISCICIPVDCLNNLDGARMRG